MSCFKKGVKFNLLTYTQYESSHNIKIRKYWGKIQWNKLKQLISRVLKFTFLLLETSWQNLKYNFYWVKMRVYSRMYIWSSAFKVKQNITPSWQTGFCLIHHKLDCGMLTFNSSFVLYLHFIYIFVWLKWNSNIRYLK